MSGFDDDDEFLSGDSFSRMRVESHSSAEKGRDQMTDKQFEIQQDRVYENEREIRNMFLKLECGKITPSEFRDGLNECGIRETRAMRKLLRESERCSLAPFSTFVRALVLPDYSDPNESENTATPGRRVTAAKYQTERTIPTLDDVYNAHNSITPKSHKARPEYAIDSDVVTWTTPKKSCEKPKGKKRVEGLRMEEASASFTTPSPPPFEPQVSDSPFVAQNELIKAFLAESINGAEFKQRLEQSGVGASDHLNKLIDRKEKGGRVMFSDLKREVVYVSNNPQYATATRAKSGRDCHKATLDIFDMNTAPDEFSGRHAPHSKEQSNSVRAQTDVINWTKTPDQEYKPGKRVGPREHEARDVVKWSQSTTDNQGSPVTVSPEKRPSKGRRAGNWNQTSVNIFSWGAEEEPSPIEQKMRRKKQVEVRSSGSPVGSCPWGTEEDRHLGINPHIPNVTKKVVEQ